MPLQKTQTRLTKEQFQTVSLLSIGALLEDLDVMLFLHTAIWINDLFFAKTDPLTQQLVTAFSLCSSYFLTPLGALFFGYIGDIFGRKAVIVLSTILASGYSIIITFLPTYSQIGIAAPVILTLCRMLQGISAVSEVNGAEIYLIESIKPPIQYPIVALIPVCSRIGNILALSLVIFFSNEKFLPKEFAENGWRFAFLVGSMIGIVGAIARSSLKEASEFTDRQKLLTKQFKMADIEWRKDNTAINPKIPLSTSLAYFFICCGRPMCFYFIFFHCAEVLRNTFSFTSEQVANNNLIPLIVNLFSALVLALLSYKIHPLKIIKCKLIIFLILMTSFPCITSLWNSPNTILIFQCLIVLVRFDHIPAAPIFIKNFPVVKRFRYSSFLLALASLFSYVVTSFGLVLLTKVFGNNGVLVLFVPFGICFIWAVNYFSNKEEIEKRENLPRQKITKAADF